MIQTMPKAMQAAPALDIQQIAKDYYDAVYRFCARRVGPRFAADATQETFYTAQRVIDKYRAESSVQTWLYGIANNECRRTVRQHKVEPAQLAFDLSTASPENSVIETQTLAAAFKKLKPEHREVVLLKELEGLTYDEISEIIGVPSGTVKSRLHYAMEFLRAELMGKPLGGK